MGDMNDYLWLVKTEHGDFFVTVMGRWTLEEAEKKLRSVFEAIHIGIKELVPRKRATGPLEMTATIYEDINTALGVQFAAGRGIWKACGKATEYENKMKAERK